MRKRRSNLRDHDVWVASTTGWRIVSVFAVFGSFATALIPTLFDSPAGAPAAGQLWWLALPVAVGVAAVAWPQMWRRWRFVITLVHEMGHAFVGGVLGGTPARITIGADTSGLAVWAGRRCRVRRSISVFAGYPAPGVVGVGAVWSSVTGGAGWWLLWAATLLAVVAITMTRNWRAVGIAAVSAITVVVVLSLLGWAAPFVAAGLGAALIAGGWQATWELNRLDNATLEQSDAGQLRNLTRVPSRVVAGVMAVAAAGCGVAAVWGVWALAM